MASSLQMLFKTVFFYLMFNIWKLDSIEYYVNHDIFTGDAIKLYQTVSLVYVINSRTACLQLFKRNMLV